MLDDGEGEDVEQASKVIVSSTGSKEVTDIVSNITDTNNVVDNVVDDISFSTPNSPDDFPEVTAFQAGTHTDMAGNSDNYPVDVIREIVKNYNPADPAPVVIGHPKVDAPAWAWIDRAREEGGKLLLKLREISPEFRQWVKEGKYKKVSVSLYPPDGNGNGWRLRHLGYLGAMPPAVKGLPVPQYAETGTYIEFSIEESAESASTDEPSDQPIEPVNQEIQETMTTQTTESPPTTSAVNPAVTSPDNSNNSFAEQEARFAQREQELAAREKAFKERELQFKRDRIANFCEGLIASGKLLPAHKADQIEFMMSLDENRSIDFAEGKKLNSLDYYQAFLKNQPQVVHFGEVAGVDSAPTQQQENEVEAAYKKSAAEYAEAWKGTVNIGGNK